MGPLEAHRAYFAELITANVGQPEGRLTAAFASTCRERFMGPGPWKVVGETGYIETSSRTGRHRSGRTIAIAPINGGTVDAGIGRIAIGIGKRGNSG